jgi:hypothetical protein
MEEWSVALWDDEKRSMEYLEYLYESLLATESKSSTLSSSLSSIKSMGMRGDIRRSHQSRYGLRSTSPSLDDILKPVIYP